MTSPNKIIFCVPGIWQDANAVAEAVAAEQGHYEILDGQLYEITSQDAFQLDITPPNSEEAEIFQALSQGRFSDAEIEDIQQHKQLVYLIADAGNIQAAAKAMLASQALLRAGGLALKVDSSGITHTKTAWLGYMSNSELDLLDAYVAYINSGDHLISCGMHTFGLPEAKINFADTESPCYLIKTFLTNLLIDSVDTTGATEFQPDEIFPMFQLEKISHDEYEEDHIFHNDNGVWSINKSE